MPDPCRCSGGGGLPAGHYRSGALHARVPAAYPAHQQPFQPICGCSSSIQQQQGTWRRPPVCEAAGAHGRQEGRSSAEGGELGAPRWTGWRLTLQLCFLALGSEGSLVRGLQASSTSLMASWFHQAAHQAHVRCTPRRLRTPSRSCWCSRMSWLPSSCRPAWSCWRTGTATPLSQRRRRRRQQSWTGSARQSARSVTGLAAAAVAAVARIAGSCRWC